MIHVVFCSSFVHLLLHLCLVSNCEELSFIFFFFHFGFRASSPRSPHTPCVAEGDGDGLGLVHAKLSVYQTKLMYSPLVIASLNVCVRVYGIYVSVRRTC